MIIAPQLGSDPEAQTLIRLPTSSADPYALRLLESEVLDDGALRLEYAISPGIPTASPQLL